MWWIYFDMPAEHVVDRARGRMTANAGGAFLWGYGHYVVFASAAAAGAGIAAAGRPGDRPLQPQRHRRPGSP